MHTQVESLNSIKDKIPSKQTVILDKIRQFSENGLTTSEVVQYTNYNVQTVTARLNELMQLGLIRKTNVVRLSASTGKNQVVWQALPEEQVVPLTPAVPAKQRVSKIRGIIDDFENGLYNDATEAFAAVKDIMND